MSRPDFTFHLFWRVFCIPVAHYLALSATMLFVWFGELFIDETPLPVVWLFIVGAVFESLFVIFSYFFIMDEREESEFGRALTTIMYCGIIAHLIFALFNILVPAGDVYAGIALALGVSLGGTTVAYMATVQLDLEDEGS